MMMMGLLSVMGRVMALNYQRQELYECWKESQEPKSVIGIFSLAEIFGIKQWVMVSLDEN